MKIKGVVSINAIALQQDEVSVITSVEQEKTRLILRKKQLWSAI